jgi:hypothetical protein
VVVTVPSGAVIVFPGVGGSCTVTSNSVVPSSTVSPTDTRNLETVPVVVDFILIAGSALTVPVTWMTLWMSALVTGTRLCWVCTWGLIASPRSAPPPNASTARLTAITVQTSSRKIGSTTVRSAPIESNPRRPDSPADAGSLRAYGRETFR